MQLFADSNADAATQCLAKSDSNFDGDSYCDSNSYCNSNSYCDSNGNTIPDSAKFCRSGHNHRDSWKHWADRLSKCRAGVWCHQRRHSPG
jgi:hypothetical protein